MNTRVQGGRGCATSTCASYANPTPVFSVFLMFFPLNFQNIVVFGIQRSGGDLPERRGLCSRNVGDFKRINELSVLRGYSCAIMINMGEKVAYGL